MAAYTEIPAFPELRGPDTIVMAFPKNKSFLVDFPLCSQYPPQICTFYFSAWLPLQNVAVKTNTNVQIFGGVNFLEVPVKYF